MNRMLIDAVSTDPFAVVPPERRWLPGGSEGLEFGAGTSTFGQLPPLVPLVRQGVADWRASGHAGASATTRALLEWWFGRPHFAADGSEFRYYFAQREAVESAIWLREVCKVRDKHDLLRFDSSGRVSSGMMPEDWLRFVVKMATGCGKTKTMSLLMAWSYFHRLYEPGSDLARNVLLIAPNIIVLDRLYRDFAGLRIFHEDPVLPENRFKGRDWESDFRMRLHRQDDVRVAGPTGNIFLTNIHRVSAPGLAPSAEDEDSSEYFLGPRPKDPKADSGVDLGEIVREVDELLIVNDEAHHIHTDRTAWFGNIQDIHNRMRQRGRNLSLQLDFTATPKDGKGRVFPQTISDYPLVEAIHQNVVKRPVIPDEASARRLKVRQQAAFSKRFADHIKLGVEEWRKTAEEYAKVGKKALLFVMTEDTKTCDEVAAHLESEFLDLRGKVLVIHTKRNGEISETGGKKEEAELRKLREQANTIDDADNPHRAVVSVLMLREGWDVRNVTTVVGLRPMNVESKILPEQTLGRGLRLMEPGRFAGDEKLSVIGTPVFMDFVREVEKQGVRLETVSMGPQTPPQGAMIVEVDRENPNKDIAELDIAIPLLSPRLIRDYERIGDLNPAEFKHGKIPLRKYPPDAPREIIFRDILTGEESHRTLLSESGETDHSQVVGYFAYFVMRDLRMFSHYDFIYAKVREFIRDHMFEKPVDLANPDVLRNLAEPEAGKTLLDAFRNGANAALFLGDNKLEARGTLRVSEMRPFISKRMQCLLPKQSPLNRIVGDSGFELRFAEFLDGCPDIASFAKNYLAVGFRLEYAKANGELSHYHPDFLVRKSDGDIYVVETKGLEEADAAAKFARLRQWCEDVNAASGKEKHRALFVRESVFDRHRPKDFSGLIRLCADESPHSAAPKPLA